MEQIFNWKRLLITILIVVVTAGAVGGSTYYVMSEQAKKDKAETDRQIAALEKQVNEVKTPTKAAATTTATTTAATDPTAGWKTYTNNYATFKYPTNYTLSDVTSTRIGTGNNYPWYDRSDLVKYYLEMTSSGKEIGVKIIDSTETGAAIGAFGGAGVQKEAFKVGALNGYYIGNYGQAPGTGIEMFVMGAKYTVVLFASDTTYLTDLRNMANTIRIN